MKSGLRFGTWWLMGILGLSLLTQAAFLPSRQTALMEEAYQREVTAVQELAGAVLSTHPEWELEVGGLLTVDTAQYRAAGEQALGRYGYRAAREMTDIPWYRESMRRIRSSILIAVGSAMAAFFLLALSSWLHRKEQMERISDILGAYLSRNYSFTQSQYRDKKGRGGVSARVEEQLRQLGAQIRLHQSRLHEEKESTKVLVTDVSHQLKTPIAALRTCFELYLEAEDQQERQEFLDRSRLQMDKLETLTGTLMNISRLESAMISLKPEPVLLEDVIVDAVNGVYAKARAKAVDMELEPAQGLVLTLDRKWTAEAIGNILDNAVKYSPPDSRVRIRVQRRISFARIEIEDEGIGIAKEEYNRVFQRFYRGDSEAVQGAEGAGVGLYLTRLIVERQGGTASVRSVPGKGSIFVLQLPYPSVSKPLDSL